MTREALVRALAHELGLREDDREEILRAVKARHGAGHELRDAKNTIERLQLRMTALEAALLAIQAVANPKLYPTAEDIPF